MTITKARVIQYIALTLILTALGGAYWYFQAHAAVTLNKSGVSGTAKTNASLNALSTNGLVGEWSFNGADVSGTTAYDRSVNTNNGTLTNGPTPTIGKLGQAINFDGTDDHVTMGAPSTLDLTGSLTISAWIYPRTFGTINKSRIVDKDSSLTVGYIFSMDNANVANGISFAVNGTNDVTETLSVANSITLNQWQYVTVTFDSNRLATIYVNGVSVGSKTLNAFSASSSGVNFAIGGRTVDNARNFNGLIDEVRVYNRAISAAEVANLYALGAAKINASQNTQSTSGLAGLWSFNGADVSGITAYDRSGNANNGTLTNGPTTTIGKVGQAINFDGTDDKVTVGAPSALNLTGPLAISAWIYPRTFGANNRSHIVNKDAGINGYVFFLDNTNVTSGISFAINGANAVTETLSVANSIALNQWQYVAVTFDSNKLATIYINGVSVGSKTLTAFTNSSADSFVIGGRASDDLRNVNGFIDEVRVYNRALSAAEVASLYNAGR